MVLVHKGCQLLRPKMGIPHFFKKYESYFGKELFGVYWDPNEQDKTIKPFVAICSGFQVTISRMHWTIDHFNDLITFGQLLDCHLILPFIIDLKKIVREQWTL